MRIYMHIPSIKGDVLDDKHQYWIAIKSMQHQTARDMPMPIGQHNTTHGPGLELSKVILTKYIDRSSGPLFQHLCDSQILPKVIIEILQQGNACLQYTLEHVGINKRELNFTSPDHTEKDNQPLLEKIELSYRKIAERYQPQGLYKKASPYATGYDLAAAITL